MPAEEQTFRMKFHQFYCQGSLRSFPGEHTALTRLSAASVEQLTLAWLTMQQILEAELADTALGEPGAKKNTQVPFF